MASTCDFSLEGDDDDDDDGYTAGSPVRYTPTHSPWLFSETQKQRAYMKQLQDVRSQGGVWAVSFIHIQCANLISSGEGNSN